MLFSYLRFPLGSFMSGHSQQENLIQGPESTCDSAQLFPETDLNLSFQIPYFSEKSDLVPIRDPNYHFNADVTKALLAGFTFNRRVMIQGFHGTGKSTHIEQVASRLNWPCLRINLDGQISRMDLIGKDAITLKDGKQVTEFVEGLIPFALQRPIALVFDEYDAGQPDVMFVIQQMLERNGSLTLLEQNRIISPHSGFRIFATTNTVGLGNLNGLYQGTQVLNQGQIDRWDILVTLNYLPPDEEQKIILSKVPELGNELLTLTQMVQMANLTRQSFENGDLSTLMSTRTIITWAENWQIFKDLERAFQYAFLNKCNPEEHLLLQELYQRCFAKEL